MKRKEDITNYITNFDCELSNKLDFFDVHLSLMYNEIVDIQSTTHIFKVVEAEWNNRATQRNGIHYSNLRTTLFEALPYRIVIGLSKILANGKEYSLLRTSNILSQMPEFSGNRSVINVVNKISHYVNSSDMAMHVATLRDQLFAHLDKECVVSDGRIDAGISMQFISEAELYNIEQLICNLYEACFESSLSRVNAQISNEEIIKTFFWM